MQGIYTWRKNKLPAIRFAKGCLLCSNQVRDTLGINPARDRVSDGPDDKGIYCRFIPKRLREQTAAETIAGLTGPGTCGGCFFLIHAEDAAGLEFFTMSSGDAKYGLMNSLEARTNEWDESKEVKQTVSEWVTPQINVPQITGPQKIGQKTIVLEDLLTKMSKLVKSLCSSKGHNNSEIAFYDRIPLSKIGEVYLHKSSTYRNWLADSQVYKNEYELYYGEPAPEPPAPNGRTKKKPSLSFLSAYLKEHPEKTPKPLSGHTPENICWICSGIC